MAGLSLVVVCIVVLCAGLGGYRSCGTWRHKPIAVVQPMFVPPYIQVIGLPVDRHVCLACAEAVKLRGDKISRFCLLAVQFAFHKYNGDSEWVMGEDDSSGHKRPSAVIVHKFRGVAIGDILHYPLGIQRARGSFPDIVNNQLHGYIRLIDRLPALWEFDLSRIRVIRFNPRSLVGSHFIELLQKYKSSEYGNDYASKREDRDYSLEPRQSPPAWLGWLQFVSGFIIMAWGFFAFVSGRWRNAALGLGLFSFGILVMGRGIYLLLRFL
jgi:hypothetical protein